ncbi:hypothetical protein C1X59_05605 [Pseudomonas sp. FW215-R2]|uniref:nuclear transport factor 2 family protein n=1 Tax=unclassified Pseudomonas TaxID=196821 RepID=UPI000C88EB0E|nr:MULTISPECIES: nuclear transport factor 2 family protein [unclassified Pseudomonas]PMX03103.1 hypothetical protein C1X59_05605 [Pseudomonas sp. FW215-R2]PMX11932.1 hypothetical protein C1X60_05055 [Pseudomonas sp. FW215-L1]PMX25602.1 hypothetical protein C1X57_03795 [Pseudomonas sp. FW215-E1]PNA32604.1 hypothetical protein C1X58_03275 [Pseudomonas sp. FW215-R4]
MVSIKELPSENLSILQVLNAYHAAMVKARTADLDRLLEPDYSLVHITGYVQPKHEWLDLIWSGDFNYHQIDLEQDSIEINIAGNKSTIKGRGVFSATINGINAPWRLKFTLQFKKYDDSWVIANARYTSF